MHNNSYHRSKNWELDTTWEPNQTFGECTVRPSQIKLLLVLMLARNQPTFNTIKPDAFPILTNETSVFSNSKGIWTQRSDSLILLNCKHIWTHSEDYQREHIVWKKTPFTLQWRRTGEIWPQKSCFLPWPIHPWGARKHSGSRTSQPAFNLKKDESCWGALFLRSRISKKRLAWEGL